MTPGIRHQPAIGSACPSKDVVCRHDFHVGEKAILPVTEHQCLCESERPRQTSSFTFALMSGRKKSDFKKVSYCSKCRYQLQLTPDNSNQNRFPLDFHHTFTVILPSITRTPDNLNLFQFPLKVRVFGSQLFIKHGTE